MQLPEPPVGGGGGGVPRRLSRAQGCWGGGRGGAMTVKCNAEKQRIEEARSVVDSGLACGRKEVEQTEEVGPAGK